MAEKETILECETKYKNLERVVYIVGIMMILMTLPQIYKIYVEKNASGVSIITWIAYTVGAVTWTTYGFIKKDKPILIVNSIWVFMDLLIIVGCIFWQLGVF